MSWDFHEVEVVYLPSKNLDGRDGLVYLKEKIAG